MGRTRLEMIIRNFSGRDFCSGSLAVLVVAEEKLCGTSWQLLVIDSSGGQCCAQLIRQIAVTATTNSRNSPMHLSVTIQDLASCRPPQAPFPQLHTEHDALRVTPSARLPSRASRSPHQQTQPHRHSMPQTTNPTARVTHAKSPVVPSPSPRAPPARTISLPRSTCAASASPRS